MAESASAPVKNLSLDQLASSRKSTEAISAFLEKQLRDYLGTLQLLLLPERVLGRLGGSRSDPPNLDKTLAELQENYRRLVEKPFGFPKELETDWLSEVGANVHLHRWEYTHEIAAEAGKRPIQITSPTRWILGYNQDYTVAQAIQAYKRRQDRRGTDQLRQFLVNELVLQVLVQKNPGLTNLLSELHYDTSVQFHPGLSGLPLIVIQSQIPTFLPPESVIAAATALSGVPAFIELVDLEAVQHLPDRFQQRISELA